MCVHVGVCEKEREKEWISKSKKKDETRYQSREVVWSEFEFVNSQQNWPRGISLCCAMVNLLLLRETGFVLGPAVDIKLQQSVYTTDFWFLYKFLKRSCRSSQYWDSKKQRNRPTFLLRKPRLWRIHALSRKYWFCETVWLKGKGGVKWKGESGVSRTERIEKKEQVTGISEGRKMGDGKENCDSPHVLWQS